MNLHLDQMKKRRVFILIHWQEVENIPHIIYGSEFGRRIYNKELSESNRSFVLTAICEKLSDKIVSPEGLEETEIDLVEKNYEKSNQDQQ